MKKFGLQDFTVKDVLISILIVLVTCGYYFDNNVRKGITEVNLLGITIHSFEFDDIASFIYFTKMKILIIMFSIIWFFTCRHWWRSSILVITTIELMKLVSILNFNQEYIDEIEFYTSLPITIPIVLLIIFISKRINAFNLSRNLRSDIDNKINDIFFKLNEEKKSEVENLKNSFINLKMKEKISDDEFGYLNELIEMRNNFYKV